MAGFRIPVPESPEPRSLPGVTSAPLENPRTGAAQGLAQIGRVLETASEHLYARQQKERAAADAERVMVEMGQLSTWIQDNIDNPENGALASRGLNAKGVSKSYLERFSQVGASRRLGLANEEQRRAFDKLYQSQYNVLARELMAHEGKQLEVVGEQGYQATLNLASSNAARATLFGDAAGIAESHKLLTDTVVSRGLAMGWKREAIGEQLIKESTLLHNAVLTQLGKDKIPEAKWYLSQVRGTKEKPGTMDGVEAAKWDSRLADWQKEKDHENIIGAATGAAETYFQKYGSNTSSVEKVLAERFKNGEDPRLLNETRKQYAETVRVKRQEVELGRAQSYDGLYSQVIDKFGRSLDTALKDPMFRRAYTSLPGGMRDQMQLEIARVDKEIPEHLTEWGNLVEFATNPGWSDSMPVERFATDWRGKVGEKRWSEALTLYKQDRMRDRTQDSSVQAIMQEFDANVRSALDFKRSIDNPDGQFWENAPDETRRLAAWGKAQMMRAIQVHRENQKKKATDTFDPMWYQGPMGDIVKALSSKTAIKQAKTGTLPGTPEFNLPRRNPEQNRALAEKIWRSHNPGATEVNRAEVDDLLKSFEGGQ